MDLKVITGLALPMLMGITMFFTSFIFLNKFGSNRLFKNNKHLILIIIACLLPMLFAVLENLIEWTRFLNFLQHMIGGGVAVGFVVSFCLFNINQNGLFYKWLSDLDSKKRLIFLVFLTYSIVSAFGVANELVEFFFDKLGTGIYSVDRFDTWFDLTANSVGGWLGLALAGFRIKKPNLN
jgi:hypothetical protein